MATKIQRDMPSLAQTSFQANNGSIPLIEDEYIEDLNSVELQDMQKTENTPQESPNTTALAQTNTINPSEQNTLQKPSYTDLFTNGLFLSRILILCVTVFCFILSLCYTMGQILSLLLSEYWCPPSTIEQVHANSRAKGLNEGESGLCWKAQLFVVNRGALWSFASFSYEWDFQKSNILKFAGFVIITVTLFLLVIVYIYRLFADTRLYRLRKLGKTQQHKKILTKQHLSVHKTNDTQSKCCMLVVYNKIYEKYCEIFYRDSGWWCTKKLLTEIFELFVQTTALLYYNGYVLLSSPKHQQNDVTLAHKPEYIILFAVFLSINSMFAGITWLLYVFKPLLCHGFLFEVMVYAMDVIFDIFYTLFPLIVALRATTIHGETNIAVGLGELQTEEQITFWAAFIPLSFLCYSSYSFSWTARRSMEEHFGTLFLSSQLTQRNSKTSTVKLQTPSIASPHISDVSGVINSFNTINTQHISDMSANFSLRQSTSFVISSDVKKHQILRKTFLIIISFIFAIYSTVLLSLVVTHFNHAIPYCSSVVHELNTVHIADIINSTSSETEMLSAETSKILERNPELFLYDFCTFPVYPFQWDMYGNSVCECRQFEGDKMDPSHDLFIWDVQSLKKYFNLTLIDMGSHILLNWKMLEKFSWKHVKQIYRSSGVDIMPFFNLTKDMFGATELRVFEMTNTKIGYIDDAIKNWKMLVYLKFSTNDHIFETLPESIGQLSKLQYLEVSDSPLFKHMPDSVCNLTNLRAFDIKLTDISFVQHCIGNKLLSLQSIMLSGMFFLDSIPLSLFNHPNLEEISAVHSQISIDSLIEYNNFGSFTEFDNAFKYSKDKTYWFEGSPFCDEYIPNWSNFYKFVNDTQCCRTACEGTSNRFDFLVCKSYDYRDGICDNACRSAECHFDGGDCTQLCDCDPFTELGNGTCDTRCNTTDCLYDGYDCLPLGYDVGECQLGFEESHCNISWVGDGWCDLNCLSANECGNDLDDCRGCNSKYGVQCSTFYDVFDTIANSQTNDNMVNEMEIKAMWEVALALGLFDADMFKNYSEVIPASDMNGDQLLDLEEALVLTHFMYGVTLEKAQQIDCSKCLDL